MGEAKRHFKSLESSLLRKRMKMDHSGFGGCKCEKALDMSEITFAKSGEESVSDPKSKWQTAATLKFPSLSQEQLREIYGQKRNDIAEESEESDDDEDEEDDDDEVLTLEDLKETEGYKLAMEGLAAMRAKEARHNETDSRKLNEKLQSTKACEIIVWS